jgi:hypothetical protein
MKKYLPAHLDRVCFCCNRRESKIDHVRVAREGPEMAERMRTLMSWVATA